MNILLQGSDGIKEISKKKADSRNALQQIATGTIVSSSMISILPFLSLIEQRHGYESFLPLMKSTKFPIRTKCSILLHGDAQLISLGFSCSRAHMLSSFQSTVSQIRDNGEARCSYFCPKSCLHELEKFTMNHRNSVFSVVIVQLELKSPMSLKIFQHIQRSLDRIQDYLGAVENFVLVLNMDVCINFHISKCASRLLTMLECINDLAFFQDATSLGSLGIISVIKKFDNPKYPRSGLLKEILVPLNAPSSPDYFFSDLLSWTCNRIIFYLSPLYSVQCQANLVHLESISKYILLDSSLAKSSSARRENKACLLGSNNVLDISNNHHVQELMIACIDSGLTLHLHGESSDSLDTPQESPLKVFILKNPKLPSFDLKRLQLARYTHLVTLHLSVGSVTGYLQGSLLVSLRKLIITHLQASATLDFRSNQPLSPLDLLQLAQCQGRVYIPNPPIQLALAGAIDTNQVDTLLEDATNLSLTVCNIDDARFVWSRLFGVDGDVQQSSSRAGRRVTTLTLKMSFDAFSVCSPRITLYENHHLTHLTVTNTCFSLHGAWFPRLVFLRIAHSTVTLTTSFARLEEMILDHVSLVQRWTLAAPQLQSLRLFSLSPLHHFHVNDQSAPQLVTLEVCDCVDLPRKLEVRESSIPTKVFPRVQQLTLKKSRSMLLHACDLQRVSKIHLSLSYSELQALADDVCLWEEAVIHVRKGSHHWDELNEAKHSLPKLPVIERLHIVAPDIKVMLNQPMPRLRQLTLSKHFHFSPAFECPRLHTLSLIGKYDSEDMMIDKVTRLYGISSFRPQWISFPMSHRAYTIEDICEEEDVVLPLRDVAWGSRMSTTLSIVSPLRVPRTFVSLSSSAATSTLSSFSPSPVVSIDSQSGSMTESSVLSAVGSLRSVSPLALRHNSSLLQWPFEGEEEKGGRDQAVDNSPSVLHDPLPLGDLMSQRDVSDDDESVFWMDARDSDHGWGLSDEWDASDNQDRSVPPRSIPPLRSHSFRKRRRAMQSLQSHRVSENERELLHVSSRHKSKMSSFPWRVEQAPLSLCSRQWLSPFDGADPEEENENKTTDTESDFHHPRAWSSNLRSILKAVVSESPDSSENEEEGEEEEVSENNKDEKLRQFRKSSALPERRPSLPSIKTPKRENSSRRKSLPLVKLPLSTRLPVDVSVGKNGNASLAD